MNLLPDFLYEPYQKLYRWLIDPVAFEDYERSIEVDGISIPYIYYPCQGKQKKGTIVCLPGVLGIQPYFYPLLEDRSITSRFDVIVPENLGFLLKDPRVASVTSYTALFLKKMRLNTITIVANSLGVIIGKKLEIEHRLPIEQQIWIGCSGLSAYYTLSFDSADRKDDQTGKSKVATHFFTQYRVATQLAYRIWSVPVSWIWYYRSLFQQQPLLIRRLKRLGIDTKYKDFEGKLDQLESSVCIVHGDNDEIVSPACVDAYREGLSNVEALEVHTLSDCGHIVLQEHPQKVLQIVRHFLLKG